MKESVTISNKNKDSSTKIYFDFDLLSDPLFLRICKSISSRFAIITDDKVELLYGNSLLELLKENELNAVLFSFPSGEENKNRKTMEKIENEMFEAKFGRDSCIIALGGGVVTDLAGFIAATYCRGIPFVSIPTSLLCMVDASIGGKTGINVSYGKNLLGAIYSPKAIFMDFTKLTTLSEKEMRNGAAEMIKHSLIADRHLFEKFSDDLEKWEQRDLEFISEMIYKNCLIKKKFVEEDLQENGKRRVINFGHTIGHALETIEGYRLSHGEAIAIGMVVESFISLKSGFLEESEFDEIYRLFKLIHFPLKISKEITIKKMIETMSYDKKAEGGTPRFIILDGIGKVISYSGEYCTPIEEDLLHETLGWMISEFSR